jgi:ABC transport system ATP-binding/permease protein
MDKLVISDDEGHTTVVPLLRDEITIGRKEGSMIRLTERNVSRSHARLLKRNGSYIIEDLGSYNGVTLNGERIDAKAELSPGDQLGIGDYDLALQSDVIASASTVPAPKLRSQPPPRLVVLSEPAAGAEFTLNKPALRIGRDERLDIWINHKSISHEHAEFQVVDGKVTVFDL